MILRAVPSAMADDARVLVIDHVLGDGDASDPVRLNDLSLMAMGGSSKAGEPSAARAPWTCV